MKKLVFTIIIVFSSVCLMAFVADITFEKLPKVKGSGAFSVQQIPNGGYYFSSQGYYHKMDELGNMLWSVRDSLQPLINYNFIPSISLSHTNGLVGINVTGTDKNYALLITELNEDGNIVNRKKIESTNNSLNSCSIIKTGNSGYLALGFNALDSAFVYKLNNNFDLIWEKSFFIPYTSFLYKLGLVELNDGNFLVWGNTTLINIDGEGNENWRISTSLVNDVKAFNDRIYLLHYNKIEKLNLAGDLAGGDIQTFHSSGFAVVSSNEFIVTSSGKITKIDSLGNVIWENTHRGRSKYMDVKQTYDMGVIAAGSISTNYSESWILKVDEFGNYSVIELLSPKGGENIGAFSDQYIQWYSNFDYPLKIELSIDGGANWQQIATNISSASSSYAWKVPLLISDDCFIRLTDLSSYYSYSKNTIPFSISLTQYYDYIAANECLMWIGNNGDGSHDPRTDGNGFYWPGGLNATQSAIFEDGLFWGGFVNGDLRVNGSSYRQGLLPGEIFSDGTAGNPDDSKYKIYKLKRNWESLPDGIDKQRYEYDYNNWPSELGAPVDEYGNPEYIGNEVLFYIANDLDTATTQFVLGTNPIGLEFQTTVWAIDSSNFLKDVVFKKYKIINKSKDDFNDVYLSYWADDDLGFAGDDFVGCDTNLSLAYSYNDEGNDDIYGSNPPAVGHMFLQTPVVTASEEDSAFFNNKWQKNFTNVPLTSFMFYIGGSIAYRDPQFGIEGATQLYYNMQGFLSDGNAIIDPTTNDTTNFALSGDPVAGTGWYEGPGWEGGPPSSDRRKVLSVGKFDFFAGDTQEVVVAIFMGQGNNRLESVTKLKETAAEIRSFYLGTPLTTVRKDDDVIPVKFKLEQNYPNPFNPATIIKYSIPKTGDLQKLIVHLNVFDILGREVTTLVNKEQAPGNYEVEFKVESLSSGVYFYNLRIEVEGKTRFNKIKKMILLK